MDKIINQRVNFASVKNPMDYPDFLEVQLKSFNDFLQLDTPPELRKNDGLYKVFSENFPIADTRGVHQTRSDLFRALESQTEALLHGS